MAEWLAQQIREALSWEADPEYLIRENDEVYGEFFKRWLHAMGIRDRPITARSPWQNVMSSG
jgi:hypothetical protein